MSRRASISSPQPPGPAPAVSGWVRLLNDPLTMPLSLLLITLVAYAPALLHGGFIWDDHVMLTDNPFVKAADGLPHIWSSARLLDYFPLTSTSLWLEWQLWGMNAWGYHLTNILLHAGSAILLWRGLRLLTIPGAALAALIFAVHPVNVESVAWIAERKNTLCMFFYALAFCLYQRFEMASPVTAAGGSGWKWYWLALGAFGLSLLSKAATVMFPGVLLLCAWWRRGKITWRDAWQTLPFFAAAAVLSLVAIRNPHLYGDVVQTEGFAGRLATAGWAVWFYLYKAVLPLNLMFVYPRWHVDPRSILAWLPLAALAGCLVIFWWRRRSWGRPLLFALGYFLLMLFPVAGFFNIYFQRYSLVADHWQYFSIISVIALAVAAGNRLARKTNAVWWGRLCGAAVVTAFSVLTWRQSGIYHDEETLWRATLARNPDCWMADNNLGILLAGQGEWAEAMQHYERALQFGPDTPEVRCNLGGALAGQGKLADAIQQYQRALQLDPGYAGAYIDWGDTLAAQGKLPEAAQQYERALQLAPGLVEGHYNLAVVLAAQGKRAEAIQHYQQALQLDPDFVEAHPNLAAALTAQGDPAEAFEHLNRPIELRPDYAPAHFHSEIHDAAKAGDLEKVKALLKANPDLVLSKDNNNDTPLHFAALNNRKEVVEFLLANKAEVNAKDNDGMTALMLASNRGYAEVVQALLAAKADVNAKDEDGRTSLIVASNEGCIEVVQALLAAKADVNAKTASGGATALMGASINGHVEVVQALLAAKADVNIKATTDGATALYVASQNGHTEVVQALLAAKADVNVRETNYGATALMQASVQGQTAVVRALLAAKADVNARDNQGRTALMAASYFGHADIVELLKEAGAK